jgi:hypothetical protein
MLMMLERHPVTVKIKLLIHFGSICLESDFEKKNDVERGLNEFYFIKRCKWLWFR